jgi:hypothetical protein
LTPEQIEEAQRMARDFKPSVAEDGPTTAKSVAGGFPNARAETAKETSSTLVPRSGLVNVKADDEASEIFVDDMFVGNTPARLRLPAGPHRIEVRKSGFKPYRKQMQILEGSELTLKAELEKE